MTIKFRCGENPKKEMIYWVLQIHLTILRIRLVPPSSGENHCE
jgi:hypothetical protein